MHDVNIQLCMPGFSGSKIISHQFHIDNDEVELGIGYGMIIGKGLMVQLGMIADFNENILEWYKYLLHVKDIS